MNGLRLCLMFCSIFIATAHPGLAESSNSRYVYSILDFGAKGDGKTLCTAALQSAIDTASQNGGGTVFVPAGKFLTGSLIFKDHITLHLDSGAVLLGSTSIQDYQETIPSIRSYTDNYVRHSLIYGENLEHVAITGRGTIDGQGQFFRKREYIGRPYIIRFISCSNVLVEGITLIRSPMWMQHYLDCDDVIIRGVHVFNHVTYNNDGLDIDNCRNVRISDCTFDSDDDALCLKSTTDKPCEDVTITNCVLSSHCNAFKMGTESNGGFKNISLSNCTIVSPRHTTADYGQGRGISGISLEIVDGGTLDRVAITNIAMQGVSVPLFLRLGNRARPFKQGMEKPSIGTFQNVTINNLVATGVSKTGCSITGQPDKWIENVSLQNVSIEFEGGGTPDDAHQEVPHKPTAYPESSMFGVLPSYGFYSRYVKGLTFQNVKLSFRKDDPRSALIFQDVQNLRLDGLEGKGTLEGSPVIVFNDVQNAFLTGCRTPGKTNTFLQVNGGSRDISLMGNDLSKADHAIVCESQLIEKTVRQMFNILK